MTNNKVYAIILAAGSGKRMKSDVKKQFINVEGKPLIAYTIEKFNAHEAIDEIIIVTNEDAIEFVEQQVIERYDFHKVVKIINGGAERQDSVYNGLKQIYNQRGIVLIHDGARPFVDNHIIERSILGARKNGAVVVGVPVKDTLKVINDANEIVETPNRNDLRIIHTPQSFDIDLIWKAHEQAKQDEYYGTDDAVLIEKYSTNKVVVVESSYKNIKITTPEDLVYAKDFFD